MPRISQFGNKLTMKNTGIPNIRHKDPLRSMGENIRTARLTKGLTIESMANYAGISRNTLRKIEQGKPTVSIGSILAVLVQLGLEKDISWIAFQDYIDLDFLRTYAGKYYRSKLEKSTR